MSTKGILPLAGELFRLMGIDEPLPRVDYVQRPVSIDLSASTEQELRWMAEAQEGDDEPAVRT
jgi:hypothetical protein